MTALPPEVEKGQVFSPGDEGSLTSAWEVEKLDDVEGVAWATLKRLDKDIGAERGRVRADSLRYGDAGWMRAQFVDGAVVLPD